MSQYADDRDVGNELRRDLEDEHDMETYDFDPVVEISANDMLTIRAALICAHHMLNPTNQRYLELYERLVSVPRLVVPPF